MNMSAEYLRANQYHLKHTKRENKMKFIIIMIKLDYDLALTSFYFKQILHAEQLHVGPFHVFIISLKSTRFIADLYFRGKTFHILAP